ncbi:MAG TPA: alpha/beta hydrolase [Propionibacteriaceae bacterium]
MVTVDLPHGTLHYHEAGSGTPIVFLHGYLMGASLWDPVIRLLEGEFRCLTPELPFGAQPTPMRPDADLTTAGVGRLVADFLQVLELDQVILVGNDSGGAIAQVVAARHPQHLGGLVLTSCDAFDNHPPKMFRPLITATRVGALTPMLTMLRSRPVRSLPSAYGWLTRHQPPHELIDGWIGNYLADKDVRRETRRLLAALGDDAFMVQIAAELADFTKPVLLAWAADDKFFPLEHARRLAGIFPNARLEQIEDSRTWVMRDQPERTADLIGRFARTVASAVTWPEPTTSLQGRHQHE